MRALQPNDEDIQAVIHDWKTRTYRHFRDDSQAGALALFSAMEGEGWQYESGPSWDRATMQWRVVASRPRDSARLSHG